MANYNKSFNFRNGVQVDEDNFLVNSLGLVGIGTTIPRSELDVYGDANVSGTTYSSFLSVGIATFSEVNIGTGITILGDTGQIIGKFYGDGAGLFNIPTSQWVDVDPAVFPGVGAGYSSIYAAGTVGIATTVPRFYFQSGGTPTIGESGVGIDSTGNIIASGVITATSFVGSGAAVTSINASNVLTGTLDALRLPSNINISGIATIQNLDVNSGSIDNLTGIEASITNVGITSASIDYLVGTAATIGVITATSAVFDSINATSILNPVANITNLSSSGITVGILTATDAFITTGRIDSLLSQTGIITNFVSSSSTITSLDVESATIENLVGTSLTVTNFDSTNASVQDLIISTTISPLNDKGAALGSILKYFSSAFIGDINIGVGASNEINTRTTDLSLDSATGFTIVDDNLSVTGYTYLTGITTVAGGFVPNQDQTISLGSLEKRFSKIYIDNITIGDIQDNTITTQSGNLILDSNTNIVEISSNIIVNNDAYFLGITSSQLGFIPDGDKNSYLGRLNNAFSEAYINEVTIGVAGTNAISTREGNLVLESDNNFVVVNAPLSITEYLGVVDDLSVGFDSKSFYVDTVNQRVGIGTSIPSEDVQIIKTSGQLSFEFTSPVEPKVSLGLSPGMGNDSGYISYSGDVNIANKSSTGDIILDLSSGTGVNTTSSFKVLHKGLSLISLNHTGNFGINNDSPTESLDIVGNIKVSGIGTLNGSLTVGVGLTSIVLDGDNSRLYGSLNGNVVSSSGISTFWELQTDSIVSLGSTLIVRSGISSFPEGVLIGVSEENPGITTSTTNPAILSIKGDSIVDGTIVLTNPSSTVAIATIATKTDDRPNLGGDPGQSNFPNIDFGVLQVNGGMSVIGFSGGSATFVPGPNDQSASGVEYLDSRCLNDQNYQFRVGVNTHVPRSCMDLGASNSPLILPAMSSSDISFMLSNPTPNTILTYGDSSGLPLIPGSLVYNTTKRRAELGVDTQGTLCGITTLASNASGYEAFIPPKLTTTQANDLDSNGIPDGAIIYNITTNKLQLMANGSWVNLN